MVSEKTEVFDLKCRGNLLGVWECGSSLMLCSFFKRGLHLTANGHSACTPGSVCNRQQCVLVAHRATDRIVLLTRGTQRFPLGALAEMVTRQMTDLAWCNTP